MPVLPTFKLSPATLPGDPIDKLTRAVELHHSGKLLESKALLQELVRHDPRRFDILTLLAVVLTQLAEYEEALRAIDRSLKAGPDQARAHDVRGFCLYKLGRLDAAIDSFKAALALGHDGVHRNLGTALSDAGRHDEAIEQYQLATQSDPDPTIFHDLAIPLMALRRFDEAIAALDTVIEQRPDYAEAYFLKSIALLDIGDFTNGWNLFEWRWRMAAARPEVLRLGKQVWKKPLWLGDRVIQGKTILLHAEQGYGDIVQFSRFVPDVVALGARVIFQVPPPLKPLMRSLEADIVLVGFDEPVPEFDLHCPLMSLAKALNLQPNNIPAPKSYLRADPDRLAAWGDKLGPRTRPRIGLQWFGSMLSGSASQKSMAFDDIVAVTDCDADFFALQKQHHSGPTLAFQRSDSVADLGEQILDFADTAAVMTLMDLIITVDTGPAHVAGALGRPVWIMLPSKPEWRWPDQGVTPWYPSARLFRQTKPGDWHGPLATIKAALPGYLKELNFNRPQEPGL